MMRSGSSRMPSSATSASRLRGGAELAREHRHERRGQMLGDEDRHADPRRKLGEEGVERVDAAGRGADREHVDRVRRHRPQLDFARGSLQGAGCKRHRRMAERASAWPSRISEKRPLKRPVPGLGSVSAAPSASAATVSSAPSSASEETIITLAPPRRGDDPRDRLQAAGAGHFEVEHDDVDAAAVERVDGVLGGAGDGGDLEPGIAFDHPAKDRARDHRIVDDHQPHPAARAARSGWRSRDLASARSTGAP